MYYDDVLEALYQNRVRYLLVGGLAVTIYGVPRATHDIDIIISTDKKNVLKVISILEGLDYLPRLPVDPKDLSDLQKVREWIEKRNLKAFSYYHRTGQYKIIDIVLVHPLDFDSSYRNRTEIKVGTYKVKLVSIDDLIKMKEGLSREQDKADVASLRKVKDEGG